MEKNRFVERLRPKKKAYDRTKKVVKVKVVNQPRRKTNLNRIVKPPLPNTKYQRLIYYDWTAGQVTGTLSPNAFAFTLNGLYRPDAPAVTARTHQPMGFDQMMSLYEHYTVISCKATVNFFSFSSTIPVTVFLHLSPDGAVITSTSTLVENGQCVKHLLTPDYDKCTLTMSCNIAKYVSRKVINENDYRGTSASNPAEQVYLMIGSFNEHDATQPTIDWNCTLEYYVKFSEPRKLAPS